MFSHLIQHDDYHFSHCSSVKSLERENILVSVDSCMWHLQVRHVWQHSEQDIYEVWTQGSMWTLIPGLNPRSDTRSDDWPAFAQSHSQLPRWVLTVVSKKVWFRPLSKQRLPSVQCLSWRDHVRLTGCLNLMPDFCPWWPLCKLSPWCCWWYFSLWFTLLKAFANLWPWQCHRSAVHIPCWMSVCHKIPVLVFAKFTLLNPLNQSLVVWIEHFFPNQPLL